LLEIATISRQHKALLQSQVQHLRAWSTNPIQLNRDQNLFKLVGPTTWQGYEGHLYRVLGFMHLVLGIAEPTLHHLLNAQLVMQYTSWAIARGMGPTNLCQVILQVQRVVAFMEASGQLQHPCQQVLLGPYKAWLQNLAGQISCNLQPPPRPTMSELQQQQLWVDPRHVLVSLHHLHEASSQLVHSASCGLSMEQCITIMKTTLCCSLFGYLPPMRVSVVTSLQRPEYTGPCMWPDCQHKHICKGNRLEWVQQLGSSSSGGSSSNNSCGRQLRVVLQHHKVVHAQKHKPFDFVLPPDMATLYSFHLQHGLKVVLADATFAVPEASEYLHPLDEQPFVFLVPTTCRQVSHATAGNWWHQLVVPAGHTFSPQAARAGFVTMVREDAAAGALPEGFSEQGAAAIMGHHVDMWSEVYDRLHNHRLASDTVLTLQAYRQQVLAMPMLQQCIEQAAVRRDATVDACLHESEEAEQMALV
jgi:hypothetical protein